MSQEFWLKHRPTRLSEVVGQAAAVKKLRGYIEHGVPHFLLLTGPSGVGKTTLARILRIALKCDGGDFRELNAADNRGIDTIRAIRKTVGLAPMNDRSKSRVWLIDEAHQLTSEAQGSFLKMLEEPPDHAYFILATTDPQRLKRTIITRASVVELRTLTLAELKQLVVRVIDEEGMDVSKKVQTKLCELSDGSPRQALVFLYALVGIGDEEDQLDVLQSVDPSRDVKEISKAMLYGTSWVEFVAILKGIDDLDSKAETIRWMVLGYMSAIALNDKKNAKRACQIIDIFSDNFFDTKKAGLIRCCYEVLVGDIR